MFEALQYEFMRNALMAGLLASIICGVMGTLVVVNRMVFLSGGIAHARNATIFGQRTIDRSPCGTGTCARMAVLHASRELGVGHRFVSEGLLGTRFVGEIIDEVCGQ